MATAKVQVDIRLSADAAAAAKLAAAADRVSLDEYIERLVAADAGAKQAASLEYARAFLAEWGDFIESEAARADRR